MTVEQQVKQGRRSGRVKPPDAKGFGYNPALDGIRAIAVIMIIGYHAHVRLFDGAFFSVDMFLVLSGYLITSLILVARRDNHVDFKAFLVRRARRLLPALFLLLVFVGVWTLFMTNDMQRDITTRQSWASLFFVNNWMQIDAGDSYFQQFGSPSPLKHTWTLGVEGQFYLLFPTMLVLMIWRRWRVRAILLVTALMWAASAITMALLFQPGVDPSRLYYGTDTRIQSPLAGALLAIVLYFAAEKQLIKSPPMWLGNVIGLSAATALLYLCLTIDASQHFMFLGAFTIAGFLVAAVIWSVVTCPGSVLHRILSSRPLVAIGLISYGIYLWHYPFFILISEGSTGFSGLWLLAFQLAATLGMAVLSYFVIERPVRLGALKRLPKPQGPFLRNASIAAVVGVLAVASLSASASARTVEPIAEPSSNATGVDASGPPAVPESFVIVGDSNAPTLGSQFQADWAPGWAVNFVFKFGCGGVGGPLAYQGTPLDLRACFDHYAQIPSILTTMKPTLQLLLLGEWEQFDRVVNGRSYSPDTPEWRADLKKDIKDRLTAMHAISPRLYASTNGCHNFVNSPVLQYMDVANDPKRQVAVNEVLRDAVSELPFDVGVVDLHKRLCADGYTNTIDGVTMRSDGLHYTKAGSGIVWRYLYDQIRKQESRQAASSG